MIDTMQTSPWQNVLRWTLILGVLGTAWLVAPVEAMAESKNQLQERSDRYSKLSQELLAKNPSAEMKAELDDVFSILQDTRVLIREDRLEDLAKILDRAHAKLDLVQAFLNYRDAKAKAEERAKEEAQLINRYNTLNQQILQLKKRKEMLEGASNKPPAKAPAPTPPPPAAP